MSPIKNPIYALEEKSKFSGLSHFKNNLKPLAKASGY
jgi:hypothetical protein